LKKGQNSRSQKKKVCHEEKGLVKKKHCKNQGGRGGKCTKNLKKREVRKKIGKTGERGGAKTKSPINPMASNQRISQNGSYNWKPVGSENEVENTLMYETGR